MEIYAVFLSLLVFEVNSLKRDECGVSHIHNYGNRIVGGREALKGEFPWMVSLQKLRDIDMRFHHFCGGVLLNKQWILTAAHCVDSIDPIFMKVVVGTNHISPNSDFTSEEGIHFNIEQIIYHDRFGRSEASDDIALLRISGEINFKVSKGMVNSVCLPEEDYHLFGSVTATGWGRFHSHSDLSSVLLAVDVEVTTQQYCRSKYGNNKIGDSVFCALSREGKDTCSGDSGGPVIQIKDNRAVVVGIVSYGSTTCSRSGWPGVYTEVSKYLDWIYDNMN